MGSKLKCKDGGFKVVIGDLSKNEFLAAIFWEDGKFIQWTTQQIMDDLYELISSPRWIPEKDNIFWYYELSGAICCTKWEGDEWSIFLLKSDNVFKTREECQKKIDEINAREI